MVVVGAKGHAKEILDVLDKNNQLHGLMFYDDFTDNLSDTLYEGYKILRSFEEFNSLKDKRFILGLGGVKNRKLMYDKFISSRGEPFSVISNLSAIGNYNVVLGKALNIMHHVSVFNDTEIGLGSLINSFVSVHHDSVIGEFCEISPGARILGRTKIGDFSSIGANAVILPDVVIGKNVIVGAGAVITKNIPDNETWVGIPGRRIG